MHGLLRLATLVALAAAQCRCGVIFQTVYGWSDQVEREATRAYPVAVSSEPAGVWVTRLDPGDPIELGPAPVVDVVMIPVHQTVEVPRSTLPMFVGAALDVGIALLSLAGLGALAADQSSDQDTALIYGYLTLGAASAAFADLIFAAIYANAEEKVVRMSPRAPARATSYLGVKEGYKSMISTIELPNASHTKLTMAIEGGAPPLPGLDPVEPGGVKTSTISD